MCVCGFVSVDVLHIYSPSLHLNVLGSICNAPNVSSVSSLRYSAVPPLPRVLLQRHHVDRLVGSVSDAAASVPADAYVPAVAAVPSAAVPAATMLPTAIFVTYLRLSNL